MEQISYLSITPGERVTYMGGNYYIKQILDLSTVLVEHETNGKILRASIKDLGPLKSKDDKPLVRDIVDIPDEDWKEAERRYAIILPILQNRGNSDIVTEVSINDNVGKSTQIDPLIPA
jgi:putative transposase